MEDKLKRLDGETKLDYIRRLTYGKLVDKTIDLDYTELAPLIFNQELSSCECRKRLYGVKSVLELLDQEGINNIDDSDILNELELKTIELQKERYKLSSEKNELNKRIREQARIELYLEKMTDAIRDIQPLNISDKEYDFQIIEDKDGLLTISDIHFGKEIEIKDFKGNVINKYNEKVFEHRMYSLLWHTIDIIHKEKLEKLNIFNLADSIDGILRFSQLQSLQYGIIDSVIKFSEFMAEWLNKLSEYVAIEYYSCEGNHDELRLLKEKGKGDFPNENVNKLIMHFLEMRLKDNKNVIIHNEDKSFIFTNIAGLNIFGYHGEDKNLSNALKDLQIVYNEKIDLMLAGHLHSSSLHTVGMGEYGDIECIRVPSICGIDDYSLKIRKSARAGAKLFILEKDKGKTITYDIDLNNIII